MSAHSKETGYYSFAYPDEQLRFRDHFSSLLFSAEWLATIFELASLGSLTAAAFLLPPERCNVRGSMSLKELSAFLLTKALVSRFYNTYLEAVFFSFPEHRTQPSREHALKAKKDMCGRQMKEFESIARHDRLTLVSQFGLNVGLYYLIPGYYPGACGTNSWSNRVLSLVANHYVMSFGMYWAHRALHVVPWLWENIHIMHHYARHPLSRNTYQDHWFDNFCNAIIGHCFAQVLVPLDRPTFWFSHIFRICESLEKHSGVSGCFNIAHSLQRFLPFAQMPHHHDWHHEGHKGCNYTFSSLGGIWDCVFMTRKAGRAAEINQDYATRHDKSCDKVIRTKTFMDRPWFVVLPVIGVGSLVAVKLSRGKAGMLV